MNLPNVVTSEMLAKYSKPEDNMAIRCILRRISNLAPYTVRGKLRHYIFKYNASVGAHILDVPVSVWTAGLMKGTYRDNLSVAHDMQGFRSPHLAPLVIIPIPFGNQEAGIPASLVVPGPDTDYEKTIEAFGKLLHALDAPQEAIEALEILKLKETSDEARATAINMIAGGIIDETPATITTPPAPTVTVQASKPTTESEEAAAKRKAAAAEKMRRSRARKKAEKDAAKAKTGQKSKPAETLV